MSASHRPVPQGPGTEADLVALHTETTKRMTTWMFRLKSTEIVKAVTDLHNLVAAGAGGVILSSDVVFDEGRTMRLFPAEAMPFVEAYGAMQKEMKALKAQGIRAPMGSDRMIALWDCFIGIEDWRQLTNDGVYLLSESVRNSQAVFADAPNTYEIESATQQHKANKKRKKSEPQIKLDDAGRPKPKIQITAGRVDELADEAEDALISTGAEVYQRGKDLVEPVLWTVPASGDRMTEVAGLKQLNHPTMIDHLSKCPSGRIASH